jgi:hypothetical protein
VVVLRFDSNALLRACPARGAPGRRRGRSLTVGLNHGWERDYPGERGIGATRCTAFGRCRGGRPSACPGSAGADPAAGTRKIGNHRRVAEPENQPRGLFDGFEGYRTPTDADYMRVLTAGLVIPDTNVLLNLYRYNADTRADLFAVFEKLGNRLWTTSSIGRILEDASLRCGIQEIPGRIRSIDCNCYVSNP